MLHKNFCKTGLAALAVSVSLAYAPLSSAALVNGNFEAVNASAGDIPGLQGWTTFEPVFTNSTLSPGFGPVSHDAGGTQSAKMFGPFVGGGAGGAFQFDNSVVAGTTYDATAHVMNWLGDPLNNLGIFQLSFWSGENGTGEQLALQEVFVDSSDDGVNTFLAVQDGADISDWTELSISLLAPEGTASARVFLLHIQIAETPFGGSIFWDDVSLNAAPPAVPVPAAVWLFGSGLLGLVGVARRKRMS